MLAPAECRRLLKGLRAKSSLKGELADLISWQLTFNHENVEVPIATHLFGAGTQWNPFSQRLIFYSRPEPQPLSELFDQTYFDYFSLLSQYHETLHLLLFEPVYTGKLNIRGFEEFKRVYFGFEAIAVWHVEQGISPHLDFRFPDGERLNDRRSVTQRNYSNVVAFNRMGFDKSKTLEIFQQSYSGQRTPMLGVGGIFSPNCAKRFYAFHLDSISALRSMYKFLLRYRILDEFYPRFCAIDNLPTFLEPDACVSTSADSILQYGRSLSVRGRCGAQDSLRKNRRGIKIRRHLQTRAYFGTLLSNIIKRGDFFSTRRTPTAQEIDAIISSLDVYLDTLRSLLLRLSQDARLNGFSREIVAADQRFTRTVHRPIAHLDLWVSRRYLFREPERGVPDIWVGIGRNRKAHFSNGAWLSLLNFVSKQKRHMNLVRSLDSRDHASRLRFLTDPKVCPSWSRPLKLIHPRMGSFDEIALAYG